MKLVADIAIVLVYLIIGATSVCVAAYFRPGIWGRVADDGWYDNPGSFFAALFWPIAWPLIGVFYFFIWLPGRMEQLRKGRDQTRRRLQEQQARDLDAVDRELNLKP